MNTRKALLIILLVAGSFLIALAGTSQKTLFPDLNLRTANGGNAPIGSGIILMVGMSVAYGLKRTSDKKEASDKE
jgi:hypothetical protein